MNGPGWTPAVEATLRMRPAPRPSIAGRNSLVRWVSAVTLTWIIRSSVAASVARNGPVTPNPALLRSTSSSTSAARSVRKISSGAAGSARSAGMTVARMLCALPSAAASCFSLSALRATSTTSCPSFANNFASSSPMPLEAPVISAFTARSQVGVVTPYNLASRRLATVGSARHAAAQDVQRLQSRPTVARREELRRVSVPDHARPVDHVCHPARHEAQRPLLPVELAHGAAPVGQEQERQLLARGEPLVRTHGIRAHADHLGTLGGERLVAVAERARLECAPRRGVFGVEVEHDALLAEQVTQLDRLAPLVREREVRRDISDAHLPVFRQRSLPVHLVQPMVAAQPTFPQCAADPPGTLFALCMRRSSGSDSTKHAPNNRNSCSNESISACRVTLPFSTISAFESASGAGVPVAMSRAVMPASRSRVTSLNAVTFAIKSARWIAVKRCTSVAETAIPTLPPSWRIRLNSPVPFGILLIGRSASARFVSGTKIRPSPTPRKISGQKKSAIPLSVVKWACFHIERAKIETPARIESRPSNLPVVRPIVAIVNALASAPGRITNPVCSAVKFWRFCRYTGSTNTVAYRQIPSTPPNTTPTASCRLFRMRRSTTGCSVVSSCHTNAISEIALTTPYITTSRESNQSSRSPRSSIVWSVPMPTASSSSPG